MNLFKGKEKGPLGIFPKGPLRKKLSKSSSSKSRSHSSGHSRKPEAPRELKRVAGAMKSANPEISREQAIKAIAGSEWAQDWATAMCSLGGRKATPECVKRMSRSLAEEVYRKA